MTLVFLIKKGNNYVMAGAQRGNLCAENKQALKQKRAPGGRATAKKFALDMRRTFDYIKTF
jgi:hypothetical protein